MQHFSTGFMLNANAALGENEGSERDRTRVCGSI